MVTYTYAAPSPLNGDRLEDEVDAAGFGPSRVWTDGSSVYVQVESGTQAQVQTVVNAHTGAATVDQQNLVTLRQRAETALTTNATYLALNNPTNAQNLAQIRTLTRECSGLIRLLLGRLDTIDGT